MTIVEIAKMYFGTPYLWGGDSPLTGMDCSGFVLEVLRSLGYIKEDMTAQSLYKVLRTKGYDTKADIGEGSILFFGKSMDEITHTAIALDYKLMIEAGGGNHSTIDIKTAEKQNAYIRIRPIRSDLVATIKVEGATK